MKATDIVNVEMTALDAFKLRGLMGKTNASMKAGSLFDALTKMTTENCFDSVYINDALNWQPKSKLTKWALSQFEPEKTEQQIKIEKLQQTIDDAKAQIEELEG